MRNLFLLSALCVGLSAAGHADSTFYLVNNTYGTVVSTGAGTTAVASGSAAGTVNIDTGAGVVDSMNITVTEAGVNYLFTGAPVDQSIDASGTMYFEYSYDMLGDILLLDFPTTSLVGYAGGNLCTLNNLCGDGQGGVFSGYFGLPDGVTDFAAISGSLVPTPEPSSLMLLGTGLLATVGAVRRRLFSRGV